VIPGRVFREAIRAHTLAYRVSGGLVGGRLPGLPPMLLLDHVGARSGQRRTNPLVYVPDGENYVIVASRGGSRRNPSWYHNLRANPDTTVQVGRRRIPVRASVATAAERERLWPKVIASYRGYQDYQRRTSREIPLVIMEPR
jgi:deazaflavin-dependent oxidoreductase (nitroreductase family)